MELTYINSSGESITLKQSRPYFLTKIDGTGNIRQTVNTFKAPDQDGAFYISSTLDMRNITLEGTVVADTPDEALKGDNIPSNIQPKVTRDPSIR